MSSGIDISAFDLSVRPEDDLYGFVNGAWAATAEIPSDRARYGAFDMLVERAEAAMHEICETAADAVASDNPPASTTPEWRVGALYTSFMNTDRLDELGWDPVVPDFEQIAKIESASGLVATMASFERCGMSGVFGAYVTADAGNPEVEIGYIVQGGLGLPDRDYYLSDDNEELRAAYTAHLARMLTLAGPALDTAGVDFGDATPEQLADRVMALETKIAAAHWDKVDTRDAVKTYNKMSRAELVLSTPGFDWDAWEVGVGAPTAMLDSVVVAQPDTLTATAELLTSAPIDDWRAWLATRVIGFAAPYLTDDVSAANFDFYGRTLSGVPEQKVRWKRGVGLVESLVGDDGGKMYVERHYPERAAQRMEALVHNVTEAFRQRITNLEWMGADTRAEALTKLDRFRAKVGKPAEWKQYAGYQVLVDDLIGNVKRGNIVETARQLAKVGQPVDRDEWLMTPQTVNAYYHPLLNEIVFPAAILQPPFFDADAPDAINYGGIGAVIAHEIGHGFDDQGSRFDGTGTLRDWWTEDDRSAFDARATELIAQFNTLSSRSAPGSTVNGALTVGENIGDLCGIELAYAAFQQADAAADSADGDNPGVSAEPITIGARSFDDDQQFFLNWAQLWRTLTRPEEALRLLTIDPHSPPDLRANIVVNVDAFHQAFDTAEADEMWLAPEDRVRVF